MAIKTLLVLLISFSAFAEILPPINERTLQSRIKLLNHKPYKSGATLNYLGEKWGCAVLQLSYPVKDPFSEKFYSYKMKMLWPHSVKPVPVVLTVPTIEGVTQLEETISKQMCKLNVASIIAHVNNEGFDTGIDGVRIANEQLIRGAVALRTLLDVIEKLPAVTPNPILSKVLIDSKKVGVVALSMGSISSLLATAVDERIKALFIMGAVGNTPHTLAYSENESVKKLRETQMTEHRFQSQFDYETYLRTQITATPVELSSLLAKRNIYQIIIENDEIAPTSGQYELKYSTKNKKVFIDKRANHHSLAIATEVMINQIHIPRFVKLELL